MDEVSLHGRAWEEVVDELEYSIETMKRAGRSGRADDLQYVLDQIQDQRQEGGDPNGADLDRYEESQITVKK
jgi:hypothetical protein